MPPNSSAASLKSDYCSGKKNKRAINVLTVDYTHTCTWIFRHIPLKICKLLGKIQFSVFAGYFGNYGK